MSGPKRKSFPVFININGTCFDPSIILKCLSICKRDKTKKDDDNKVIYWVVTGIHFFNNLFHLKYTEKNIIYYGYEHEYFLCKIIKNDQNNKNLNFHFKINEIYL